MGSRCYPGVVQVQRSWRFQGAHFGSGSGLGAGGKKLKDFKRYKLSNCLIFYSCCSIFLQACVQAISETVSHLGGKFSVLLL